MAKKRTSKEQEFCFKSMPAMGSRKATIRHDPAKSFKDRKRVGLALLECLEENDPESFVEILDAYLQVNRTEIAERAHLARSTVQQAFSKHGNPTLRTMAKIVHEAVA